MSNLDPEIGYTTDGGNVFLPKRKSIGVSLETGVIQKIGFKTNRTRISVLSSFELYKLKYDDWQKKYGIEVSFYQALYFRFGRIDDDAYSEKNTAGYSINSRGLFTYFQGETSTVERRSGLNKFFTDILSVEYSYVNSVLMKSYHEIIVTYQL